MSVYTYDPKLVFLVFDGRKINDHQEGTGITFTAGADVSSTSMGVDGGSTRNINTNISWELTFTIQNGSPTNTFLNLYLQTIQGQPPKVADFMLKDGNTFATIGMGKTYIETLPSISGQLEATGREYKFRCVNVVASFSGVL